MLKKFTAIGIGAFTGGLAISILQIWWYSYYRPLGTFTTDYFSDISLYLGRLPGMTFIYLIITFAVSAFFSGLIGALITTRYLANPFIIGIILMLPGIYYILAKSNTDWWLFFSLIEFIPFSVSGHRLVQRLKGHDPDITDKLPFD